MTAVDIVTFGCRLNAFESEVIRGAARQAGLEDAVIVNTCAVTAEAERQAGQAIRRARREHPGRRIIVTGCAAALSPERYAAMPEVDLVLDNQAKLKAESYCLAPRPVYGESVPEVEPRAGEGSVRARAYLQVQQGCDHRCTFCIIPYARGPSRSLPLSDIVEQARGRVAEGAREIVLTGVDLTAYGADLPEHPSLGRMVQSLLAAVPELPRLRLSSLDPSEIDAELWDLLGSEPRLMPHLHLSLQAGDDLVLKRMKRRHSRSDAIACARRARELRLDIAIGADLIAGFPTETDEMFRRSLDLVAECGIAFLHVFPYSPRPGTPAARMPPVDPGIVRARAASLRQAGAAALAADLRARIGGTGEVLIERPGRGRAPFYAEIDCSAELRAGSLHRMRFVALHGSRLVGEPLR
ncbi:MAG TPA: tRNA (N(6)-L-threonylcarbamoyladenosine(37)-C(2))-methylthiotransferase MtaB [Stellaceae bacterium]|jgi:threonylcarbamoyladenosine tRNA methylthiotransferase MtaB|nr:tRNA (N(6)-L-threonylcarbamoyladenosine(37)-C(2))-methylthiotransferase MtaB [Stellaceae bacterium]